VVVATTMIAATSMKTAAATAVTATAVIAAVVTAAIVTAAVGGVSRPDPKAANHEGKPDRRGDPGYPGNQFLFLLEQYLHSDTTSRDLLRL